MAVKDSLTPEVFDKYLLVEGENEEKGRNEEKKDGTKHLYCQHHDSTFPCDPVEASRGCWATDPFFHPHFADKEIEACKG